MTDQSAEADDSGSEASTGPQRPDYDLPDALVLEDPAQYRALFEETRHKIIALLSERAATVSELALTLDKPKGTIGHHVQVLADAGLVHVVRTEKVRALEAKYWGRTARIFFYERVGAAVGDGQRLLDGAAAEVGRLEAAAREAGTDVEGVLDVNRRDVRVPVERVREFRERLGDLLVEFAEEPRGGDTTYALIFGVFPSELPQLPARDTDPDTGADA
ncbi:winged helix-turn-helix domain-containing protein [Ornithinimicrobium sp. F0845]|uniref:winged helix-turn-helix domain-containing protein n=1 Tax=Ornithinimicrobium sp. F0845 TaxID=2926412 RepID=UPI001FF27B91|nr:winged helix-turn-helix domain-containing protein [Ornithinimicrobium sp. F0845]MCK0110835.1 winged helix-turn-helix domain-containing protein [Ornithinimicrobium sp. F0845]